LETALATCTIRPCPRLPGHASRDGSHLVRLESQPILKRSSGPEPAGPAAASVASEPCGPAFAR